MKKIPQRLCIGCQEMKNKKDLIRVLKTEDGSVILDKTGKKNGRGAYVCRDAQCLEKAIRQKGLEHSLKMPISVEIYDNLRKELSDDAE